MDEVITKRIHISGLTPAISAKDLNDRLGSFGTVKSLDGIGAVDGVGQPRKFAYATLETTKGKLARCMNLLSGVTWKGAKLRLGEAKPDYRERIAKEHAALKRVAEEAANQPIKKRRRLPRGVQGVHAPDMSLVTPENAVGRAGWRVTATGRLIKPLRMRPDHPLPEPVDAVKPDNTKGKTGESRKRMRDPPTRARRRTIDPTKFGSTHIKGVFLENAAVIPLSTPHPASQKNTSMASATSEDEEDHSSEESEGEDESQDDSVDSDDHPVNVDNLDNSTRSKLSSADQAVSKAAPPIQSKPAVPEATSELVEETSKALGLLQSLFGDKEEWGSAESVGSDIDEAELRERDDTLQATNAVSEDADSASDSPTMQVDQIPAEEPSVTQPAASAPAGTAQKTKLKDLFAPREEEAGFSLLGHLDLDLELEDDMPFELPAAAEPAPAPSEPLRRVQPTVTQAPRTAALDPSKPFFFPSDNAAARRRVLDPTDWKTWFYRTDTPEAIRQRWEESKGELTAGWKRRHREAIKIRRRRGGGGGVD
ncbi:hypothetical protein BD413DRAFT_717831 [Trametes elegans]|nr:hypothetical protein BD413DRAFT_717831 [Trametes elegans]